MPGASAAMVRDTDADWREVGRVQPFWGVLTQDEYRSENLTPQTVEAFYLSGIADVAGIVGRIKDAVGEKPSGRALDFGCGAGRLAEAMCAYAEVTGYDVSPGMLEAARSHGGRAAYVDRLPDGPFDWINSHIVFQHIPPERGLPLMRDLLARLSPRGIVSLQVTVWREDHLKPRRTAGWRQLLRPLTARWRAARAPTGEIQMYDYDLSAVVELLHRAKVETLTLSATNHGGHHGVLLVGRKAAPVPV